MNEGHGYTMLCQEERQGREAGKRGEAGRRGEGGRRGEAGRRGREARRGRKAGEGGEPLSLFLAFWLSMLLTLMPCAAWMIDIITPGAVEADAVSAGYITLPHREHGLALAVHAAAAPKVTLLILLILHRREGGKAQAEDSKGERQRKERREEESKAWRAREGMRALAGGVA